MSDKNNIQGIEFLKPNHAGTMQLKDGNIINYGVIRFDEVEVVYYTGKGLHEIWKSTMTDDEKLVAEQLNKKEEIELRQSGHIDSMKFENIARILS